MFVYFLLFLSVWSLDPFGPEDVKRVQDLLSPQIERDGSIQRDLQRTYWVVDIFHLLNLPVPYPQQVCAFASKRATDSDSIDTTLYASSIANALSCSLQIDFKERVLTVLKEADEWPLTTLLNAIVIYHQQKIQIDPSILEDVVSTIMARADGSGFWQQNSESDGSPFFTGLALSALSVLPIREEHREDIESQLKELLSTDAFSHFDNSISDIKTRTFLYKGLIDFNTTSKELNHANFVDFLLENKETNILEDLHAIVVGLKATERSVILVPIVSVLNGILRAGHAEVFKISISDVWGTTPIPSNVTIVSVKQKTNPNTLVSGQELSGSNGIYTFDFLKLKPEPGTYSVKINIAPESKKHTKIKAFITTIKVVSKLSLSDGLISVGKDLKYEFNQSEEIQVNSNQKIFLNFKLKNSETGKSVFVQQIFAKFLSLDEKKKNYYFVVGGTKTAGSYQLYLDLGRDGGLFNSESGDYLVELIISDSHLEEPLRINVGKMNLQFAGKPVEVKNVDVFEPLPVISHKNRPEERHADPFVSNVYTTLTLLPLLILLINLVRHGNFGAFPRDIDGFFGLIFVGCIAGLFAWIVYFWWALKLFQMVLGIVALALPTIFSGRRLLASLATSRIGKTKTE